MPLRLLVASLAALIFTSACTHLGPQSPTANGLYRDAIRIAELRTESGWLIDRIETDQAMPSLLASYCRAPIEARSASAKFLDDRIVAEGGPVEAAWRARGKDLGEVDELLLLTRTRHLLQVAEETAAADCPFYLEPSEQFRGVHTDAARVIVYVEGGARAVVSNLGGRFSFGGLTVVRVFGGYGLSNDRTLLIGLEGAASAQLSKGDDTLISSEPKVLTTAALPFIIRNFSTTRFWDLEIAPTLIFTEVDNGIGPGLRVAGAFGAATLRLRGFMPMFAAFASVEANRRPDGNFLYLVSVGGRGGLDWDVLGD